MTRTAECRAKIEWVCEHCEELSPKEIKRLTDAAKADEEYKEITGQICPLSTDALTPLMREKDPEIKAEAIKSIGEQVSHGNIATAPQVKTTLANIKSRMSNRGGDHKGATKTKTTHEDELYDEGVKLMTNFLKSLVSKGIKQYVIKQIFDEVAYELFIPDNSCPCVKEYD